MGGVFGTSSEPGRGTARGVSLVILIVMVHGADAGSLCYIISFLVLLRMLWGILPLVKVVAGMEHWCYNGDPQTHWMGDKGETVCVYSIIKYPPPPCYIQYLQLLGQQSFGSPLSIVAFFQS